ncbi:hypothetical protein ACSMXN_09425 [Jatrophihabitans sp. DSM 45814]
MNADQCGVFATLIPVLLLAGYLSGDIVGTISRLPRLVRIATIVIVLVISFGESLALVGVRNGSVSATTAGCILAAAMLALGAMLGAGFAGLMFSDEMREDEEARKRLADTIHYLKVLDAVLPKIRPLAAQDSTASGDRQTRDDARDSE